MSQTFSLVCHETRQRLWIGQGWGTMESFYKSHADVMKKLHEFLNATSGKPLYLVCDDTAPDDYFNYEEFGEPPLKQNSHAPDGTPHS